MFASTPSNSDSPKQVSATCPAGKQAIGAEYDIAGGKTGASPDALLEVGVDQVGSFGNQWFATAYETDATTETWSVFLSVLCVHDAL